MTAKTRTSFSVNPSRAEEIAWLREVAESVPESTYLASLLKPELLAWFESKAKSDLSCDILEALEFSRQEVMEEASEIKRLEKLLAAFRQDVTGTETYLREQDAAWRATYESLKAEKATLRREYDSLASEGVEMLYRVRNLEDEVEDREIEIRDLKAKLYDVLVAAGRIDDV